MKELNVIEDGRKVFTQFIDRNEVIESGREDYSIYSKYFIQILKIVSETKDDFEIILNVTVEYTYLTLYLNSDEFAEKIKDDLLDKLSDYIDQITITKNNEKTCLNFRDVFIL